MCNRGLGSHCWKPRRRDNGAGFRASTGHGLSRWIVASVLALLLLCGPAVQKTETSACTAGALNAKPALCVGAHSVGKECKATVAASNKKAKKSAKKSCASKARKHTKKCKALARKKAKKKSMSSAGVTKTTSALPNGYGPAQFRGAYNLPLSAARSQTIAIVTSYDSPNIE